MMLTNSWFSNHNLNITWPLAQEAQSVMAQPDTWEKKNILWEENPTKLPFTNLQIYNLQESPGKWKEKRVNWEGRPAKWKDYSVEWEVRSATKFIKNVS